MADGLPGCLDGFGDALGASDVAWIDGRMYALTPGTGPIVREEHDGSRTVVARNLDFPIGMAANGNSLYAATASYGKGPVEGLGQIVRVDLTPQPTR